MAYRRPVDPRPPLPEKGPRKGKLKHPSWAGSNTKPYNVQPQKPSQSRRGTSKSKDSGKPLQISPVGTSRTQGYSRTKPTTIPKGYTLMTFMSSPPKYKLVKNAPKTSPMGRGKNPSVAPSRYAAQQKKSIKKRSK
jgi:hypothetical protein